MRYYIRDTKTGSATIYYHYNINRYDKLRGSTKLKMNPKWNDYNLIINSDGNPVQKIKTTVNLNFPNAPDSAESKVKKLKTSLKELTEFIEETILELNNNNIANFKEELKKEIDVHLGNITLDEDEEEMSFFKFIDYQTELKKGKVKIRTIQDYKRLKVLLLDYQNRYKTKLNYDRINIKFKNQFEHYLETVHNFRKNTIWKHFKNIKMFMNKSLQLGYHNNLKYKMEEFSVPKEKTKAIYLTNKELGQLEIIELSNKLLAIRDYFLLMSFTGMRVGDMLKLRKDNIIEYDGVKMISYYVSKLNEDAAFMITPKMQTILNRWNGAFPNDILDKKINSNYINLKIKEIANSIKLDKADKIGCHTGRRSYCTNEYLKGTPIEEIMRQSFHKTVKIFMDYIKASGKEIIAAISKRNGNL